MEPKSAEVVQQSPIDENKEVSPKSNKPENKEVIPKPPKAENEVVQQTPVTGNIHVVQQSLDQFFDVSDGTPIAIAEEGGTDKKALDIKAKVPPASASGAKKKFVTQSYHKKKPQKCLSRTPMQWLQFALAFVIFYLTLIGFFMLCMTILLMRLSSRTPTYFGQESLLRDNPGLSIKPQPDSEVSLIQFVPGAKSTYEPYILDLELYYKYIQHRASLDLELCVTPSVCAFNPNIILREGCTIINDYGFGDGQPCILIKMNKVYGFVPDPYESTEELKEAYDYSDRDIRFLSFSPVVSNVGVMCDGYRDVDKEYIHDVTYVTVAEGGIPAAYFPYTNEPNYKAPFIFAVFNNVTRGVVVQVSCKLFAKNIYVTNKRLKDFGAVNFALFINDY